MTITTLDPQTALIVIDLQHGVTGIPAAHPVADIVRHSRALADAFRRRRLPVVLVNMTASAPGRTDWPTSQAQPPANWADLLPELGLQPHDHRITKRTWGAFTGTDLEAYLRTQGVTQVVIVGIATRASVESTARQAFDLGFHVTLVTDAMTDRSLDVHQNSVNNIFPRLGETGSTQDILRLLGARPQ